MGISGTPEATGEAFGRRIGASLRRVAVQSIADAAEADISWDTEDYDSDGFIAVTGTTLTVPAGLGGMYAITARGGLPAEPTVTSYSYLTAGGNTYFQGPNTSTKRFYVASIVIPLLAAGTVKWTVYQDHTGAQDFTGHLFMYRIGD
jgi:hypothetical protein